MNHLLVYFMQFNILFINYVNTDLLNSMNKIKRSKSHLLLSKALDTTSRQEILNEYFLTKLYEHLDKLNLMIVPEFSTFYDGVFNIVSIDARDFNEKNSVFRSGSKKCSLEEFAFESANKTGLVCPWHWLVIKRENRYPFNRAIAKCNCENCQAKTVYDSDTKKLSYCQPITKLEPVLLRETVKYDIEQWSFSFEQIPVSCACAIKINPVR